MKILAIEHTTQDANWSEYGTLLKQEALKVWELYQAGFVREFYFRLDRSSAVLVLECTDADQARSILSDLPLVSAGLIDFELIPLRPYPGLSRLFE